MKSKLAQTAIPKIHGVAGHDYGSYIRWVGNYLGVEFDAAVQPRPSGEYYATLFLIKNNVRIFLKIFDPYASGPDYLFGTLDEAASSIDDTIEEFINACPYVKSPNDLRELDSAQGIEDFSIDGVRYTDAENDPQMLATMFNQFKLFWGDEDGESKPEEQVPAKPPMSESQLIDLFRQKKNKEGKDVDTAVAEAIAEGASGTPNPPEDEVKYLKSVYRMAQSMDEDLTEDPYDHMDIFQSNQVIGSFQLVDYRNNTTPNTVDVQTETAAYKAISGTPATLVIIGRSDLRMRHSRRPPTWKATIDDKPVIETLSLNDLFDAVKAYDTAVDREKVKFQDYAGPKNKYLSVVNRIAQRVASEHGWDISIDAIRNQERFSKLQYKTCKIAFGKAQEAVLDCYVADTHNLQVDGLQRFASLSAVEGMIFPYQEPRLASFHMADVQFPIDIIFVGSDGRVIKKVENIEPGTPGNWSMAHTAAVIEANAGFCEEYNIQVGCPVFELSDNISKTAEHKIVLDHSSMRGNVMDFAEEVADLGMVLVKTNPNLEFNISEDFDPMWLADVLPRYNLKPVNQKHAQETFPKYPRKDLNPKQLPPNPTKDRYRDRGLPEDVMQNQPLSKYYDEQNGYDVGITEDDPDISPIRPN